MINLSKSYARSAHRSLRSLCLAGVAMTVLASPSLAQVVTDGSVGAAGGVAGPNYVIGQGLGLTNADGTALLHSFSQFDLLNGETATFTGAGTLQSIIARITGGASSIDGTITHTAGNAALFFINPNGIVFGENAFINVPGSFHVATADTLNFVDGSSIPMTATPVGTLSTSAIESFGFLGGGTGAITINGGPASPGWLAYYNGDLTLTASTIAMTDHQLNRNFATGRSELRLTAVGTEAGQVVLTGASDPFSGTFDPAFGGTITLTSSFIVGGSDDAAANVFFNAGSFIAQSGGGFSRYTDRNGLSSNYYFGGGSVLFDGANFNLSAQTLGTTYSTAETGSLVFDLSGQFAMNNSVFYLREWEIANVFIGAPSVSISADSFSMVNSRIETNGQGLDAGAVTLNIAGDALFQNSLVYSRVETPGFGTIPTVYGDAGAITFDVGGVLTLNNTRIDASSMVLTTANGGAAGSIVVDAGSINADSGVLAADGFSFARSGGDVAVTTVGDLNMVNTSFFAARSIDFSNSGLSTGGDGGTVAVDVGGNLSMASSSQLIADGYNGGQLGVTVAGSASLDNSSLYAQALNTSGTSQAGPAGQIIMDVAGQLSMANFSLISASSQVSTSGVGGLAGTIAISADNIIFDNSNVTANSQSSNRRAGSIQLTATNDITLGNTSTLFAANAVDPFATSMGNRGGQITLNAGGSILQTGFSNIYAYGYNGGEVSITAGGGYTIDGSLILAGAFDSAGGTSAGPSGSIQIDVSGILSLNNAHINSTTRVTSADPGGEAGTVTVNAGSILSDSSSIEANGDLGGRDGGTVTINAVGDIILLSGSVFAAAASDPTVPLGSSGGRGGTLSVTAGGSLFLDGNLTRFVTDAHNSGNIIVDAGGDISLTNGASFLARSFDSYATTQSAGPGSIQIDAGGALILSNSIITASSTALAAGPGAAAGSIIINADSIFADGGDISAGAFGGGRDGGSINVTAAGDITMQNSSVWAVANTNNNVQGTSSGGDGGSLSVVAGGNIGLDGASGFNAEGYNGGTIFVDAGIDFTLQNISFISAKAYDAGLGLQTTGGTVTVNVGRDTRLASGSFFEVTNYINIGTAGGSAGAIALDTGRDLIMDDGDISALAFSTNALIDGGQIAVNVGRNATIGNSSTINASALNSDPVTSLANPSNGGDGGQVDLVVGGDLDARTNSLIDANGFNAGRVGLEVSGNFLTDFVFVRASAFNAATQSAGTAGLVDIKVGGNLTGSGAFFRARTFVDVDGAGGNAGLLRVNVDGDLILTDSSSSVSSLGASNRSAGTMEFTVGGLFSVTGTSFSAQAGFSGGEGSGGSITLSADRVEFDNSFLVAEASNGLGRGGEISVSATNGVSLQNASVWSASNRSSIEADRSTGGDGGTIIVNAGGDFAMSGASRLLAQGYNGGTVSVRGDGGISIADSFILADSQAPDSASTAGGNAPLGQISLQTASGISITDSSISAASRIPNAGVGGNAGRIDIDAGKSFIASSSGFDVTTLSPGRTAGAIDISTGGDLISFASSIWAFGNAGDGGSIRLEADGDMDLNEDPVTFGVTDVDASGLNGGTVYVRANGLFNLNQSDLWAYADSGGVGGDIVVLADRVVLGPNSDIDVQSLFGGTSGDILIRAREISVLGGIGSSPLPGGATDYDPAEILIGGTDGGRMVLEANTINFGTTYSLRSEHFGATGRGGEIILRANTINMLGVESGEIISTSDLGRAGDIRVETLDFLIDSGTIRTAGPSGGTIRFSVDREFAFTGGNIFTNIDAEDDARTDGDVYIGFTFPGFERTNTACDAQCENWPVYVPGPAPGAGGIPSSFTDESDILEAQGAVGEVIFGSTEDQLGAVVAETVVADTSDEIEPASDTSEEESPGYSYATATSRDPASLCDIEDQRRAGRSAYTELLTGVSAGSPLNLTPAEYEDDERRTASAELDLMDCASEDDAEPASGVY